MKSIEFLNEGDDKNMNDVEVNHPEIYKFLVNLVGYMALEKQTTVEAYNTNGSHMVVIKIKPSAGLGNTEAGLRSEGIAYDGNRDNMLSGSVGEMRWTVTDDGNRGNRTETWRFALPL